MIPPAGAMLLATVCNALPNAVPYALWLAHGDNQYFVDLSDVLGGAGDCGLTGLVCHGDRIYVAVQSTAAARILILDHALAPVGVISNPAFQDIHSLHIDGDSLIVCSTGLRSVLRVSLIDHDVARLCDFHDNVHLNSACFHNDALLVCCHHLSKVRPDVLGGGVIDANLTQVVIAGLGQPHSLIREADGFLILDSNAHRVVRFDKSGIRQQSTLSGFLRGATAWNDSLFVARSARRLVSRKFPVAESHRGSWDMMPEKVCIYELDANTLAVTREHFPMLAGFEIYDLLMLDEARGVAPDRLIIPDIHAVARAYYEAARLLHAQIDERRRADSRVPA